MTTSEHWLTADLHLGHDNIRTYCGRPFASVDEMNEAIVSRWNEQVRPDDRVLILGDVAMGKIGDTLPLASLLNGYKVLLAGNHDRCAKFMERKPGESLRWTQRYMDEGGFAEVHQGTLMLDIGLDREILASHFPYSGDSRHDERYGAQRPADYGGFLIHGHVHEEWLQAGRQINVGLDALGGWLVHADEVAEMIEGGPADLPRVPW